MYVEWHMLLALLGCWHPEMPGAKKLFHDVFPSGIEVVLRQFLSYPLLLVSNLFTYLLVALIHLSTLDCVISQESSNLESDIQKYLV